MRRLAACVLLLACGSSRPAAPLPHAPEPPAPIAPPQTLRVTPETISLDGEPVGDARAIEAQGRASRLPALTTRLGEVRAAWKAKHPAATLPDEQWLEVDASAGSASALSALLTAAYAGYRHVHLKVGGAWVDGLYDMPVGPEPVVHDRIDVRLERAGAEVVWRSDRPCGDVPTSAHVALGELEGHVARGCGNDATCVSMAHITFGYDVPFGEVARAFADLRRHARPDLVFALQRTDPASTSATPERSCGAPVRVSHRKGSLPADDIQKVVRAEQKKMRACYEQGLRRDAGLAGQVAVRLVINAEGRVQEATSIAHPLDFAVTGPADPGESRVTTLPDKAVVGCIVNVYRTLTFPKPDGPVTVVYPLDFGRGNAAE